MNDKNIIAFEKLIAKGDDKDSDICEWCGMEYLKDCWDYYTIKVFSKEHKICSDCYEHLKKQVKHPHDKSWGI